MFGLEKRALIDLYNKFPFVLGKRLNGLSSLIKKIAAYFEVDERKVKDLMLEYPLLMNRGMSFYINNKLGKEIFDKHWLLECFTDYNPCSFGGYRTFANLILVIDKIEKDIGTVERVYKKEYKDGTFIALLAKKDTIKYLVSLGANAVTKNQRVKMLAGTPEQQLLEKIFKEEKRITDTQEYTYHQEYVCQLNTEKADKINDILHMMASFAAHSAYGEVELKPEGNAYYLSDSEDISKCSIETVTELSNDKYNLYVSFYKLEPMGNGKMLIKALREPIEDEGFENLFDDLLFDDEESDDK